jgi:hypothetical protein
MDKAEVDLFTVAPLERKLDERIESVILQTIAEVQLDAAPADALTPIAHTPLELLLIVIVL